MTKFLSMTISLVVAAAGLATLTTPSQAATRLMSSTIDAFEYRCERHDGVFSAVGASVNCQTPTVPVSCDYFDVR